MLLRLSRLHRIIVPLVRTNAHLSSTICPSCGTKLPTSLPTCPRCQYIAPLPSSMTYFQYFNLDSTNPFTLDTRDLRGRFLQAQRLCHPDTWAQKGKKESVLAAAQSSQINKAYQILLSPLDRAQYILSLNGVEETETEKLEDKDLIMKVMEARQEVEEASDAEEISRISEINKGRIDGTVKEIERLIGEKNWEGAKEAVVRLKYWFGIESAAKERAHN